MITNGSRGCVKIDFEIYGKNGFGRPSLLSCKVYKFRQKKRAATAGVVLQHVDRQGTFHVFRCKNAIQINYVI